MYFFIIKKEKFHPDENIQKSVIIISSRYEMSEELVTTFELSAMIRMHAIYAQYSDVIFWKYISMFCINGIISKIQKYCDARLCLFFLLANILSRH